MLSYIFILSFTLILSLPIRGVGFGRMGLNAAMILSCADLGIRNDVACVILISSFFSFLMVDFERERVFLPSLSSGVWTCFLDFALEDDLGLRLLEDDDAVSYTHLTLPTNREV